VFDEHRQHRDAGEGRGVLELLLVRERVELHERWRFHQRQLDLGLVELRRRIIIQLRVIELGRVVERGR
jgi:hypothetical protein